jgi:ubiquinone/menaquinone biosynthesis C-methylase UbiE
MLSKVHFQSLLDLGSGEGVVLDLINESFDIDVCGTDLDIRRVALAVQRVAGGDFFLGDAHSVPLKDNSFDMVITLELLEHVGKPALALSEAKRVTRKYLLASVPHEPWWRIGNMLRLKYLSQFGSTPEHIHHWTLGGFKDLIRTQFTIIEVKTPLLWSFILAEKSD